MLFINSNIFKGKLVLFFMLKAEKLTVGLDKSSECYVSGVRISELLDTLKGDNEGSLSVQQVSSHLKSLGYQERTPTKRDFDVKGLYCKNDLSVRVFENAHYVNNDERVEIDSPFARVVVRSPTCSFTRDFDQATLN